ncbi:hypothetical protein U1Q18_042596 [Sarracenia purpurea var. burkii]
MLCVLHFRISQRENVFFPLTFSLIRSAKKAGFAPATAILGKPKELPKESGVISPLAFEEERGDKKTDDLRGGEREVHASGGFDSVIWCSAGTCSTRSMRGSGENHSEIQWSSGETGETSASLIPVYCVLHSRINFGVEAKSCGFVLIPTEEGMIGNQIGRICLIFGEKSGIA